MGPLLLAGLDLQFLSFADLPIGILVLGLLIVSAQKIMQVFCLISSTYMRNFYVTREFNLAVHTFVECGLIGGG